jgi:hypothetical protein
VSAEAENPDSELTFKGVVFNKMKGAMSAPAPAVHEPMVGLPATWYDQPTNGLGTASTVFATPRPAGWSSTRRQGGADRNGKAAKPLS